LVGKLVALAWVIRMESEVGGIKGNLTLVWPQVGTETPKVFLLQTCPLAQLLSVNEKVVRKGRVENRGKPQRLGSQLVQPSGTEAHPYQDLKRKNPIPAPLNLHRAEGVVERQLAEKIWHVPASLAEALLTD